MRGECQVELPAETPNGPSASDSASRPDKQPHAIARTAELRRAHYGSLHFDSYENYEAWFWKNFKLPACRPAVAPEQRELDSLPTHSRRTGRQRVPVPKKFQT